MKDATYEITDISVFGNTAYADITVTSKTLVGHIDVFDRMLVEDSDKHPEKYATTEDILAQSKIVYMDAFRETDPTEYTLFVELNKKGSSWTIDDDEIEYIIDSMLFS